MKFNELISNQQVLQAIDDLGYIETTKIQELCIPNMLEQKDIIGQSQTGTGKTCAFGVPIILKLTKLAKRLPQALVLCPTRELCIQVTNELRKYTKYLEAIKITSIYGGQPIVHQIKDLKGGTDIIVATPGRLIDHINRKTVKLDMCNILVMDEADEMLNMGFKEEIEEIISYLPATKQTTLFSATMPKAIMDITTKYLVDPLVLNANSTNVSTNQDIKQLYFEIHQGNKCDLLKQLLEIHRPNSAMIFVNTKKMADDLSTQLIANGYMVGCLHGDMKQEMRTSVMERFKSKKLNILVATDVAARGIDVDNMDIVFNYDLPIELEYYIHRIGRVGRAGNKGLAISFVTPKQKSLLKNIEKLIKTKINFTALPTLEDLINIKKRNAKTKVDELLEIAVDSLSVDFYDELLEQGYNVNDIVISFLNKLLISDSFKQLEIPKDRHLTVTHYKTSKVFIGRGKKDGIATAHIVSAIADSTNIDGKDIGKIKISDNQTIVEVPEQYLDLIIESLNKTTIKGLPVEAREFTERRESGNRNSRNRVSDYKAKDTTKRSSSSGRRDRDNNSGRSRDKNKSNDRPSGGRRNSKDKPTEGGKRKRY
ncbi:MAG: DEAD/DEAH box helicase [Erysipelotrichaceae bacterium]